MHGGKIADIRRDTDGEIAGSFGLIRGQGHEGRDIVIAAAIR
jgi:hypothetical protein